MANQGPSNYSNLAEKYYKTQQWYCTVLYCTVYKIGEAPDIRPDHSALIFVQKIEILLMKVPLRTLYFKFILN
jgi:hypothetical protein